MTNGRLSDVPIDRQLGLVAPLLGPGAAVALCDETGAAVWQGGAAAGDGELARAMADLDAAGFGWECDADGIGRRVLSRSRMLRFHDLRSDATGCVGRIVVLLPRPGLAARARGGDAVNGALRLAAAGVVEQVALTRELNEMAAELGVRYEELNLLYRVEERMSGYDPQRAREILGRLVSDCAGHLSVDAVTLYIPDEGVELHHFPESGRVGEFGFRRTWSSARGELYTKVSEGAASMVLNEPGALHAMAEVTARPVKVLSVPVMDVRSHVCGIFTALNDARRPDFTNGDVRLLELLAEHVSKVLQAGRDLLTGMLNRQGFEHHLAEVLESARGHGTTHSLLYLDLDGFKLVNDTSSHTAGDALLRQVAATVQSAIRNTDTPGRVGDDEFAVLLEDCPPEQAIKVAHKIRQTIGDARFAWDQDLFSIRASIGVVPITPGGADCAAALKIADTACQVANRHGGNRVHVYQEGDSAFYEHFGEMQWVSRVNRALEDDRLVLYAQRIEPVSSRARGDLHHEILVRLLDENGRVIAPSAFIPAAESYHLMPEIDRWVVRRTLSVLAAAVGAAGSGWTRWAINLSGQSIADERFLDFVLEEFRIHGVDCDRICFEVTETAVIANLDAALRFINELRERGCRFALDDFGSGLSSFSYLKKLPVDFLKIDGSIVRDILHDPASRTMVESVNRIGHVMGLRTIAEFAETEAIVARLEAAGVDYVQGFGVGRPAPLEEVLAAGAEQAPGGGRPRAAAGAPRIRAAGAFES